VRARVLVGLVLLGAAVVNGVQAQQWNPAALTGTVRDSTGTPVIGVTVRVGIGPETRTDSLGQYSFPKLYTGKMRVAVLCPSPSFFHAQRLAAYDLNLAHGARVRQDAVVDRTQCRKPTVDTLRASFMGIGPWALRRRVRPMPRHIRLDGSGISADLGSDMGRLAPNAAANWPSPHPPTRRVWASVLRRSAGLLAWARGLRPPERVGVPA
jgi:hypothetical protein